MSKTIGQLIPADSLSLTDKLEIETTTPASKFITGQMIVDLIDVEIQPTLQDVLSNGSTATITSNISVITEDEIKFKTNDNEAGVIELDSVNLKLTKQTAPTDSNALLKVDENGMVTTNDLFSASNDAEAILGGVEESQIYWNSTYNSTKALGQNLSQTLELNNSTNTHNVNFYRNDSARFNNVGLIYYDLINEWLNVESQSNLNIVSDSNTILTQSHLIIPPFQQSAERIGLLYSDESGEVFPTTLIMCDDDADAAGQGVGVGYIYYNITTSKLKTRMS